jgi:hypothetical protein
MLRKRGKRSQRMESVTLDEEIARVLPHLRDGRQEPDF